MNESDYLRQQLRLERTHLREVLELLRRDPAAGTEARARYLAWSTARLLDVQGRHLALLAGRLSAKAATLPADAIVRQSTCTQDVTGSLDRLEAALTATDEPQLRRAVAAHVPALTALLDAWTAELEELAAGCYRIEDWRRAAGLNADGILEERRLHAAAAVPAIPRRHHEQ